MTRFLFAANLILISLAGSVEATITSSVGNRPNIVLFVADDMGYSDAGCFGGEIETPHIDRLASDGLRFTHFYNNALCGPTRASLLTGLYCQEVGLPGQFWTGRRDYQRCVTVGELLQEAGYRTMLSGKWQDRDVANEHGFHRFFGPKTVVPISYFHEIRLNYFVLDHNRAHPPDGFFLTDLLTDFALQFLEEVLPTDDNEQPFFLYLPYVAPHWPLHARERDIAKYREKYRSIGWDELRKRRFDRQVEMGLASPNTKCSPRTPGVHAWQDDQHKQWQAERMATYAAQIDCLDRNIGRVLRRIEQAGVMDNTLILFLSDNGAAKDGTQQPTEKPFSPIVHGENWRMDNGKMRPGSNLSVMPGPADTFCAYGPAWANLSNTPYREYKWTAYEGGIITPLIVRWPKVISEGGRITHQVGHVMDIMATCLDVAGCEYPSEFKGRTPMRMRGKSLLPILQGQTREPHDALYWFVRGRAARMGDWKLVAASPRSPWELYNLKTDPTELNDLAQKLPSRVEQMVAAYQEWTEQVGVAGFAFPDTRPKKP